MKKLLFPISTFVVGIVLTLVYCHIKTPEPVSFTFGTGSKNHSDLSRSAASPVDRSIAMQRIADFQKVNEAAGNGALRSDYGFLQGFFIDAKSLKSIVDDATNNYDGVSFYIGEKPDYTGADPNILTLYFGGSKKNGAGMVGGTVATHTTEYLTSGTIYEYIDPCPTHCSDIGK